ncbi:MAG TPA: D-amino acid aminotransferase [Burkholderiaceae bacterium]|jgi:D-alanine transaminase|nr:D-amino acid aminotransferase [Burkholderiaceae bacterium]
MNPDDSLCYLNGDYLPLASARIPVLDRGFIFGDGVYEVVPAYRKRPFRLEQHLDRLQRSLAAVRIDHPFRRDQWRTIIERLIESAAPQDLTVYLQVTRGVAKRDFAFPANVMPTVFAMASPLNRPGADQRERGLRAVSVPDLRWLRCDIKSTSLLGAVLARQQAADRGLDEVIQHRDGRLTEGSASNVWVVKDSGVLAPPRDNLILEGIRYGFIQELCERALIPFEVRSISMDEVRSADELMLSAATREVLPIVELDGRPVGSGRPGPIYRQMRRGYDAAIDAL